MGRSAASYDGQMVRGGTRALDALRRAGIAHTVHEYLPTAGSARQTGARTSYGTDAATALGVDPRRIFKTLVVSLDGRLVIAIVPVAGELDLKLLAVTLGGRRATMAEPGEAERATGYVLGGISPIGQRRDLPTVLDASADAFETILVSAGRRGVQIELAPAGLVAVTSATVAAIARRGPGDPIGPSSDGRIG